MVEVADVLEEVLFVVNETSDVLGEARDEASDVLGDALVETTVELRLASVEATMGLDEGSDVLDVRGVGTPTFLFDSMTFFFAGIIVTLHAHMYTNVHKRQNMTEEAKNRSQTKVKEKEKDTK